MEKQQPRSLAICQAVGARVVEARLKAAVNVSSTPPRHLFSRLHTYSTASICIVGRVAAIRASISAFRGAKDTSSVIKGGEKDAVDPIYMITGFLHQKPPHELFCIVVLHDGDRVHSGG